MPTFTYKCKACGAKWNQFTPKLPGMKRCGPTIPNCACGAPAERQFPSPTVKIPDLRHRAFVKSMKGPAATE